MLPFHSAIQRCWPFDLYLLINISSVLSPPSNLCFRPPHSPFARIALLQLAIYLLTDDDQWPLVPGSTPTSPLPVRRSPRSRSLISRANKGLTAANIGKSVVVITTTRLIPSHLSSPLLFYKEPPSPTLSYHHLINSSLPSPTSSSPSHKWTTALSSSMSSSSVSSPRLPECVV